MSTYSEYFVSKLPTWLRNPEGRWWAGVYGAAADAALVAAKDSVKAANVVSAPVDALARLGADVALERYPDETDDAYRARILDAWSTWPWAGAETAVMRVVEQLGHTDATLYTAQEWGVPDAATRWARFWIVVPETGHGYASDGTWGDAGTWDDGGTWDSDASLEDVARTRRALRQFTNARARGLIRFTLTDTDYWSPETPWNHGTWNDAPAFIEWRF